MGIKKRILDLFEDSGENLVKEIKGGFSKQGHGKGDEIEQLTYESGGNVHTDINMPKHYAIVNKGVKASRIPFGKKTGQKKSALIEGLIKFFKKHGNTAKTALSRAIMTAKVWKKEGMSTKASARFSETGKRQQFIESTTETTKEFDKIETKILDACEAEGHLMLDKLQTMIS